MAGGDHDATDRLLSFHGEGDGGSRGWPRGENHVEIVCGENFGGTLGKLVREEPAVVAHDDFLLSIGSWIGTPVIGGCLGDSLDVLEIEVFSDDRPPAVGAKLDLCHARKKNYMWK